MKKSRNTFYVFALMLFTSTALFTSCKKDEVIIEKPPPKLEDRQWVLSSYILMDENKHTNLLNTCEEDDTWTFQSDGQLLVDGGQSLCTGENAQIGSRISSLWDRNLNKNEITLSPIKAPGDKTFTIKTFREDLLVLEKIDGDKTYRYILR